MVTQEKGEREKGGKSRGRREKKGYPVADKRKGGALEAKKEMKVEDDKNLNHNLIYVQQVVTSGRHRFLKPTVCF